MKRKRLDYAKWDCIQSKTLLHKHVNTDLLTGCVDLLDIHEVTDTQIWHFNGQDILICDKGLKWLTIMPDQDWYCISALMDDKNEILLWYIDMVEDHGVDPDGVPYYYDLYLDLVVYSDGKIFVDDMDELKDALQNGHISQAQYDLAVNTCHELKTGICSNIEAFKDYTAKMQKLIIY